MRMKLSVIILFIQKDFFFFLYGYLIVKYLEYISDVPEGKGRKEREQEREKKKKRKLYFRF